MADVSSSANGGSSLLGVLGIIFIVLKVLGVITWSWWLVLLPIYGPFVIILTIMAFVLGVGGLVAVFKR